MKIGIDVRKERDGGIGRYIRNLVSGLLLLDTDDVFAWSKPSGKFQELNHHRFYPRIEKAGLYSVFEQVSLARKVNRSPVDIFHAPHYIVPVWLKPPSVVTIHDVIHLVYPKSLLHKSYAYFQIKHVIKTAGAVITPSFFSKRELIRLFPGASDKTVVIKYGIEEVFAQRSGRTTREEEKQLQLPANYLFYAGNHKPHKNLNQLLEICEELFKKYPELFLVLTGSRESEQGAVYRKAKQLGIEEKVRFTGDLDNDALVACYSRALVFVFPSLYEGFGFPPLEAMACQTPVVAFDVATMPEVVGDGGILVSRGDGAAFFRAVDRLVSDPVLRHQWGKRGKERARIFQWDQTVREHVDVYQKVLKESGK